jgi:hypothetical protein
MMPHAEKEWEKWKTQALSHNPLDGNLKKGGCVSIDLDLCPWRVQKG